MDQNRKEKTRAVELIELISSLGHECALVGGLAVSARIRPRVTHDVDVAVAVRSDQDAESVGFALTQAGYRLRDTLENIETGYVSTLRFNHPRDPIEAKEPTVDVLFSSCGIEREVVDASTPLPSRSGAKVKVARIPHLIAMKTLSEDDERPKDREDLRSLIRAASGRELKQAAKLVALIEERGYNRDKELQPLLASFIDRYCSQDRDR